MPTLAEILLPTLQEQFERHRGVNLFAGDHPLVFTPAIRALLEQHGDELLALERDHRQERLLDYLADRAAREFMRTNQFIALQAPDRAALRAVYAALWRAVSAALRAGTPDYAALERAHAARLAEWLRATNPFV